MKIAIATNTLAGSGKAVKLAATIQAILTERKIYNLTNGANTLGVLCPQ